MWGKMTGKLTWRHEEAEWCPAVSPWSCVWGPDWSVLAVHSPTQTRSLGLWCPKSATDKTTLLFLRFWNICQTCWVSTQELRLTADKHSPVTLWTQVTHLYGLIRLKVKLHSHTAPISSFYLKSQQIRPNSTHKHSNLRFPYFMHLIKYVSRSFWLFCIFTNNLAISFLSLFSWFQLRR